MPEADIWLDDALQLCVSDRMMALLETADLAGCDIDPL